MLSSFRRLLINRRRAAGLAAAGAVAIAASGCSGFVTPPTASQQNVIGDVAVSSQICIDGFGSNANDLSTPPTNYGQQCDPSVNKTMTIPSSAGTEGQVLIGYLVPSGTGAPAQLSSPDLPGVTFTPSSDYAAWLTTHDAPPTGYQWSGYMSSDVTLAAPTVVNLTAEFTPPTGDSSFAVAQVELGDRANGSIDGVTQNSNGDPLDPSRPLDCAETATTYTTPGGPSTSIDVAGCANDQSTSATNGALTVTLNTLSVAAPASAVSVQAGTTATVPFTIASTGSFSASAPFAVAAATSAPGVTASPADSTVTPSGTQSENVSVAVPSTLAPGAYTVTLSLTGAGSACSDPTQCTRTATAALDVTAPPPPAAAPTPPAPTPTVTVKPTIRVTNLIRFNGRRLTLSFVESAASSRRLTLERKHGRRWIRVRTVRRRIPSGRHTLALRKLFHGKLHRHDRYRLLVEELRGSAASGRRVFSFRIR